jgi:hypothetical protein
LPKFGINLPSRKKEEKKKKIANNETEKKPSFGILEE